MHRRDGYQQDWQANDNFAQNNPPMKLIAADGRIDQTTTCSSTLPTLYRGTSGRKRSSDESSADAFWVVIKKEIQDSHQIQACFSMKR
jgi:hypothetical protein